MSQGYPPQPPYGQQPNGNNQQYPYYPQQLNQPSPWQQPPQYPPGYQPAMPSQQPQPKKKPTFKEMWNSGNSGKCGIIFAVGVLLVVVFACAGVMNAATSGSQSASTPQTVAQVAATDTPAPTDTPVPTAKPQPTAKPKPTQSSAQIETAYKASTTDTDVATLDKDGNNDTGNEEHFTATLIGFVKDSSGVTGGANVSDAATSSVVQVIFTPGTDISQMNAQDTIEVWGTNQGVSSGSNAFGAIVQEVVVQAKYLSDQTTGYKADF